MDRKMGVRCGIDIVDISRFEKIVKDANVSFIRKCFTGDEISYCESSKNPEKKAERYAARFAAKEAVGKALGTGLLSEGVGMHDIEVYKDERGTPEIRLTGGAFSRSNPPWVMTSRKGNPGPPTGSSTASARRWATLITGGVAAIR